MQKNRKNKKTKKNKLLVYQEKNNNIHSLQKIHLIFSLLAKEFSKKNIYDEGNVMSEYENISHAIKGLYTYLYDQKNSSLNAEDAKIFASYLMQKIKILKDLIEKTKK